ncbi:MAG TPA: NAD(P)H-hydrate epimerase, partial [Pyrinomonadaceae bacterium]|nr:NAD(P)H-hydrate epimerase [Pyrinomonadaceae bacterium]
MLCGKGNNGGDGFALARVCRQEGASVTVCFLFPDEEIGGDAKQNLKILRNLHPAQTHGTEAPICLAEVGTHRSFFDPLDPFLGPNVVVDAVFGTGLVRRLDDELSVLARQYNNCRSNQERPLFVSVDIPSGLPSDTEFPIGEHFNADITVTFTSPKPANVLVPAARSCGELVVANIGSPQELIDEQPSQLYLAAREDAATWLKRTGFSSDSYKNKRGHALLIAGSENYSGAAVLAANAAMRSGVGLVTLVCPADAKTEIASRILPEVILQTLDPTADDSELKNGDAIAVGCGLDANNMAIESFVRKLVEERTTPVIVDAGALWIFKPPAGIPNQDADKSVRA